MGTLSRRPQQIEAGLLTNGTNRNRNGSVKEFINFFDALICAEKRLWIPAIAAFVHGHNAGSRGQSRLPGRQRLVIIAAGWFIPDQPMFSGRGESPHRR
jgi:hypothetical protein